MATTISALMTATAPPCQFALLDSLRIAYRDSYAAGIQAGVQAEPVVLIHGLGSMIYTWQDVFAALAAQRRVIALDLKGYGASDKPAASSTDYSLRAQAEIVVGLLDELGIKRAALIGNSMGGAVALLAAAKYPERVTKLVLADPAVYPAHLRSLLARLLLGKTGAFGKAFGLRTLRLGYHSQQIFRWRLHAVYARHEVLTPERVETYWRTLCRPEVQHTLVATLQAWDLQPVKNCLPAIQQPALIIWGEHDRIIRPHFARRLARDLPHARLQMLPCGHVPQEELPQDFARLVNEFLVSGQPRSPNRC